MWSNQKSLKVVVRRKLSFCPPYCPNPKCVWHISHKNFRYHRHGSISIDRYPYISQRFRCLSCHRVFTDSFFTLNYRDRTKDTYEEILDFRIRGSSRRQIANFLGCSLDTVQNRIIKMARWGILSLAKDLARLKIHESIAYDGIENFSFSQYDPNNINHAVGRSSLFVYDFNFCPLNRKGRTTEKQKKKITRLEKQFGRYPSRAIQVSSKRIFERLLGHSTILNLHTDNHFFYRKAIAEIKDTKKINHIITHSKKSRNYRNPLFAINHLDVLTRHQLADFKRETIAFAKTSQSMVESFILLAVYKNYMRTKFLKKHKRDPSSNKESPAVYLGLRSKVQTFNEFFKLRITKHQVNLNEDWLQFFERKDPYSRRPIREYSGI